MSDTITVYHNQRCSKSRAALAFLEEHAPGRDVKVVKYLETPPTKEELKELLHKAGVTPFDALRRGEKEFKELGLSPEMSDEEILDAMVEHPRLIERPIVATDKGVRIARPTELIEEIL